MSSTAKRIPVADISNEAAKMTIANQHQKFGKTIGVNSCFGSSNIGQASGFIAREIVKAIPAAFMRCPLALDPDIEGPTQVLLYDDYQVTIDGCNELCLAKTLEKRDIKMDLRYTLDDDFGWQKEPGPDFDEQKMQQIAQQIIADIKTKILAVEEA
ncbi:MAG: putative zinc-binding protein [Thermoleophilia bacterium]